MSYEVNILADSITASEDRLTTFLVTFPRFILAEVNTHRMLSRNSASSRAIPTEKQIERVQSHPFIPEFNSRVKGMGVGEPLKGGQHAKAVSEWVKARDAAVKAASNLTFIDKSRANRLLEPFMWHTAIISATDWDNFFGLRTDINAQPEFRKIARMMQEAMWMSEPEALYAGDWHLPMLTPSELSQARSEPHSQRLWAEVSAGRCARVSYDTHELSERPADSQARWRRGTKLGHWSPGEHPAVADEASEYIGNFKGWRQLRKHYANEDNFESLQKQLEREADSV